MARKCESEATNPRSVACIRIVHVEKERRIEGWNETDSPSSRELNNPRRSVGVSELEGFTSILILPVNPVVAIRILFSCIGRARTSDQSLGLHPTLLRLCSHMTQVVTSQELPQSLVEMSGLIIRRRMDASLYIAIRHHHTTRTNQMNHCKRVSQINAYLSSRLGEEEGAKYSRCQLSQIGYVAMHAHDLVRGPFQPILSCGVWLLPLFPNPSHSTA